MNALARYLVAGLIFEMLVLISCRGRNVNFKLMDYIIGGLIDIWAWPIVLLVNLIFWLRQK